jgi:hypothetical protein
MTPLHFENLYRAEWDELESQLTLILDGRTKQKHGLEPIRGERVAELYRRACEHWPSQGRALSALPAGSAREPYVRCAPGDLPAARVRPEPAEALVRAGFPRAVRAHSTYVWIATAITVVPMLLMGWLVYERPDLILSVLDADSAAEYEAMYSDSAETLGNISGAKAAGRCSGSTSAQHRPVVSVLCRRPVRGHWQHLLHVVERRCFRGPGRLPHERGLSEVSIRSWSPTPRSSSRRSCLPGPQVCAWGIH